MEMENPQLKTYNINFQSPENALLDLNEKISHFGNFKAESKKYDKVLQKNGIQEEAIENINAIILKQSVCQSSQQGWMREDEHRLFELYVQHGRKWSYISQIFQTKQTIPGQRSSNYIKNKFYGSIRKLSRKLNSIGKSQIKLKNRIKEISIIRPLEFSQQSFFVIFGEKQSLCDLKKSIIKAILCQDQDDLGKQALNLIKAINKFNLETRSYYSKKKLPKISTRKNRKVAQEVMLQEEINSKQSSDPQAFIFSSLDSEDDNRQKNQSGESGRESIGSNLIDFTFFELEKKIEDFDSLLCGMNEKSNEEQLF